ncbi:MAG: PQQ-binding-like beta-propeller repeat protein [Acidobacteria bacterium]|nr:PQQ-binding-like beta-propeller repeat protein [Acidobacteriota bacterium]
MRWPLCLPLALLPLSVMAQDWPRFRGPNGSGVLDTPGLPVEFGPVKNLAWKAAVPYGQSSPIVAGGRVFLTASEGDKLITLAFDAATGREAWRREVTRAHSHKTYKANDPASPTPAADARNVYAFFPDFGLIAYSHDGKELWRQPLGPFENFYGMSSSPIVASGMVVLLCDQAKGSYLLALDAATGKQRWKRERPQANIGWGVPIVAGDQLIAVGSTRVDSYHLATGEPRWWTPVASQGSMGTPVAQGETLFVTTLGNDEPMLPSFESTVAQYDQDKDGRLSVQEFAKDKDLGEHFGWVDTNKDNQIEAAEWNLARSYGMGEHGAMAIPLNGRGRVESTAFRWRFRRNVPYVPSPVLYQGVFYMAKSGGIVTTLDPATGALRKQGRASSAPGDYYASPVAGDGKVYLVSQEGKVSVLKAGAEWEVLAVNDLGDECSATPALSNGRLFVRTRGWLWGFQQR